MSVSRSIICASSSTARAMPSMRPASSLNSISCMVFSVVAKVMAPLCRTQARCSTGKFSICLEAVFVAAQRAFQ